MPGKKVCDCLLVHSVAREGEGQTQGRVVVFKGLLKASCPLVAQNLPGDVAFQLNWCSDLDRSLFCFSSSLGSGISKISKITA